MRIIKKYSNRRLYDTESSGYITLDELSDIIRAGSDVQVLDAKSGSDLTQATLAQIVVESGAAKLLPTPLLAQMIRMEDDALAEFMQLYVAWAFQVYAETKKGISKIPGLGHIDADGAVAKLLNLNPFFRAARSGATSGRGNQKQHATDTEPEDEPRDAEQPADEVAELRSEIDELKQMVRSLAEGK